MSSSFFIEHSIYGFKSRPLKLNFDSKRKKVHDLFAFDLKTTTVNHLEVFIYTTLSEVQKKDSCVCIYENVQEKQG